MQNLSKAQRLMLVDQCLVENDKILIQVDRLIKAYMQVENDREDLWELANDFLVTWENKRRQFLILKLQILNEK